MRTDSSGRKWLAHGLCVMLAFLVGGVLIVAAPVHTRADQALDAFRSRQAWASMPPTVLRALAARLHTVENVREFMQFAEGAGLLDRHIRPLAENEQRADFVIGGISRVLTSYGNAAGERQDLDNARRAFALALLLNPRNPSALFSLGLVHTLTRNCRDALAFLDRLIALKPDPNSADAWEGGLVDLERSGMLADLKRNAIDLRRQCQGR